MATGAALRLRPMYRNLADMLAIELLVREAGKRSGVETKGLKAFARLTAQERMRTTKIKDLIAARRFDAARDKAHRAALKAVRSGIDAGDYGYCDETGEPIGVGRLLARPTATLSLEAQQRRELKQKMFGD
jgi:DnaK suppressor protein